MPFCTYPAVLYIAHITDGFGQDIICLVIPFAEQSGLNLKQRIIFFAAVGTGRGRKKLLGNGSFPGVTVFTAPKDHTGISGTNLVGGFGILFRPEGDKLRILLPEGSFAIFTAGFAVSSSNPFKGRFVFHMSVFTHPFAFYGGFETDFVSSENIVFGIACKECLEIPFSTVPVQRGYTSTHTDASL